MKSTGDIKKEERYFDNFSEIYVDDNINVIFLNNLPGKIIIEAGDNLLPKIRTKQDGDKIIISNDNTCNWVRNYKKKMNVYVGVAQVKDITIAGYGTVSNGENIKTDTLGINSLTFGEIDITIDADYLGFIVDDHTTMKLHGKAGVVAGSCYKNSLVDMKDLKTKICVFTTYSLVNADVYSGYFIKAQIGGTGNINCYGHPGEVEYKHPSGSGSLLFP